jgi:hypothetical protein
MNVPLIIRGQIIDAPELEFGGRRGQVSFTTPDVSKRMDQLVLTQSSRLADLYQISFNEILDYLEELGAHLAFDRNPYLQESAEFACRTSALSREMIERLYLDLGLACSRPAVEQMVTNSLGGPEYLDGWVTKPTSDGRVASVRAFGARTVHVMAGNVPGVPLVTIIRNAVIRSDAILKLPSNDPVTGVAIARTMIDMAPDHPITKHVSVAYWKGGDAAVEDKLYQPENIEKIVAWGGYASITHIKKYIQPGIDLITMDPKLSSSIIGKEAFADEETMKAVAQRLAIDVGFFNQEACVSARVVYIQSGLDEEGLERASRFGKYVFDAIQALPPHASSQAVVMDNELVDEIQALKLGDDHVIYGGGREGGVIVSKTDEPVDFANLLAHRITNLVPVDDLETPIRSVNAYTQTIGIYPDELKRRVRDRLVFQGAQRIVSVGYHARGANIGPHDGLEPLRRMCKWILDETNVPEKARLPHLLAETG